MVSTEFVGINKDDSVNFRKCWALGEDYYCLKNYYDSICSNKDNPKFFVFYWSRMEAIQDICESLDIKNDKINNFLGELRYERDNKLPHDPHRNFEMELEYLLRGNLMGKDPRYEYIFRAAKHCQGLYEGNKDVNNFLNSLNYLKNFVPHDHLALIKNVVHNWKEVQKEYKNKYNENTDSNSDIPIAELRRPELIELVNSIGGLILNVIEISDLLTKWDRFKWVLICYVIIIAAIVLFILFLITQPASIHIINQLDYLKTQDFNSFITSLGIFLGSILAIYKVLIVGWQKFASYIERSIATKRLKHPQYTKKRILDFKI